MTPASSISQARDKEGSAVTTTATSEGTGTKYRPVAADSNLAHIPDRGALCIEIGRHE